MKTFKVECEKCQSTKVRIELDYSIYDDSISIKAYLFCDNCGNKEEILDYYNLS